MTSQSRNFQQINDDDMVLISSASSSEDESEHIVNAFNLAHGRSADQSIRELIRKGKQLLTLAELKSRPEDFRNDAVTIYRYNFSSAVTGCDLFRDRELKELFDVVSTLKMRLSAERVFSLGCPQLRSERDVFDELLMRFSDELLDIGQSTHSVNNSAESVNVNSEAASVNVNTELLPIQPVGSSSNVNSYSGTNSFANAGISNSLAHNNPVSIIPVDQSESTAGETQSGSGSRNDARDCTDINSHSHSGQLLKDIHISVLKDFLKHVDELKSFTNLPRISTDTYCDPIPYGVFQAIQASLSSFMNTTTAQTNQSTVASPKQGKRKRSDEDSSEIAKKSKTEESKKDDEDKEEDCCSICLEPWSTGGDHRVTCLKCGHLFGLSCILKWVEQAHCCPQCKTSAKRSDLRHLFVRKITAEDTSQRDRAMRLLEEERLARRNIEQKEAIARKKLEIQEADIESLRTEVNKLKAQLPESGRYIQSQTAVVSKSRVSISNNQSTSNKRFQQFQRVNISQEGNCRVFGYCKELGMLVASQKSPNALFRGYGIRILTRDFKPLSYQPLHTAAIRDMSFRPGTVDGMLLSCGLDKCLQLTSVTSKVVVQKYTVSSPVWCCAWNLQNTNLFYAGMERGVVKEFDIRRTDSHVQDVLDYGGSPISNMQYWSGQVDGNSLHGLLVAHLQSLIFEEQANESFTTHRLPHLQAPLMNLSLHSSGRFLSSFRPGSQFPKCRYEISKLSQTHLEDTSRTVSSNCQAAWEGSNMQAVISRNCLISKPESEDSLLAITANHSNNTVCVWDCDKKKDFQAPLSCFDKAIDIKPLNDDLLAVLTDKELVLYNWRA